ncbi:MAG TPA: M1 family metallopeptidase [Phnomibacter sp.]|nr:M1 family metallopeptidase [Phnomibacter sp.]
MQYANHQYLVKTTLALLLLTAAFSAFAQLDPTKKAFTRADTLRGSLGPGRTWWNVLHYDIAISPHYNTKSLQGRCTIKFNAPKGGTLMQLDLQEPLIVDSILFEGQPQPYTREENVIWITFTAGEKATMGNSAITVYYHGNPKVARRAPWDGGWIFAKDAKGRPWMTVACQGLGASVWYPCKDHQSDEPDEGAALSITVPDSLVAVANGRLKGRMDKANTSTYRWEVRNPINTYNIVPYIGHYKSFTETYNGEDGPLDCTYWVLDYEMEKAREQFKQVKPMLTCFEYWFGPYPFYEDGYQLIQSPHLGMEPQSGIAYGNGFTNGYLGRDLSGSGWGTKWDFIIVHESGHEWFGNNITSKDVADMWIHESFTNYSETLFTQCQYGLEASQQYVQGIRRNIRNDRPIIGPYGVNEEGSGDMYYKGANMIHTIRTILQNDTLFRKILRGLNKTFYHQTVTTQQVENYINNQSGQNFGKIFDQYLRDTRIPVLEWKLRDGKLHCRFSNCIAGFAMPVPLPIATQQTKWIRVNDKKWQQVPCALNTQELESLWNKNLYINYQQIKP